MAKYSAVLKPRVEAILQDYNITIHDKASDKMKRHFQLSECFARYLTSFIYLLI